MKISTERHTMMNIEYTEEDNKAFIKIIDNLMDLMGILEEVNGDVIKFENDELYYDDIKEAYEVLTTLADATGEIKIES